MIVFLRRKPQSVLFFLFVYLLGSLGFGSETNPDSYRKSLREAFSEGREIFYEAFCQKTATLQLDDTDRRLLEKPESRIRNLYEHLMGFYYYVGLLKSGNKSAFHTEIPALSRQMAHEFLGSLREIRATDSKTKLQALLSSFGYHARKTPPTFRRFLRPMARPLKTQWALDVSQVKRAQKVSRGEKIRLAIIDSGVDPTVKEIKSQIALWKSFLDSGFPETRNGQFPYDWDGHGTAIASVVVQVAPEVELLVIKVVDLDTMADVPLTRWNIYLAIAGIYWAAQQGADIISLSLALSSDFHLLREVAGFCWHNNIVLVTSLGNIIDDQEQTGKYFPAAYETTIAVGGVEKVKEELRVWSGSAQGDYTDVVAPASDIWVELPSYLAKKRWPTQVRGNSFAVPFVAGAVALVLSRMGEDAREELSLKHGQLVETVRTILRESSSNEKLGLETPNPASGYGLLDVWRAVELAKKFSLSEKDRRPQKTDRGNGL